MRLSRVAKPIHGWRFGIAAIAVGVVGLMIVATVGSVVTDGHASRTERAVVLNAAYQQAATAVAAEESLERKYRLDPGPVPLAGHTAAEHQVMVVGNLEAISLKTGKVAWKINTHGTERITHQWSPVIIVGGAIYAVLTTRNSASQVPTSKLEALSAATGHLSWAKSGLFGPIAAAGRQVYATGLGTHEGAGSYDYTVTAMSTKTGAPAWSYRYAKFQVPSDVAVSGGIVVGGAGGSIYGSDVYALSAASGQPLWQYADHDGNVAADGRGFVTDGRTLVYASSQSHLVALNLATGHKIWQQTVSGIQAPPVGGDGVVYGYDAKGRDRAYRLSDGHSLWASKVTTDQPYLVADGRLVTEGAPIPGKDQYIAYGRH